MSPADQTGPRFPWRKILHGARLAFTPLSLLAIAFFIWRARASLADIVSGGIWYYLLAALCLWVISNVVAPLISVRLFGSCGSVLPYVTAFRIHASRLPAKYLPGGIWHSVGRANDYLGLGHGIRGIGLYFVMENFLIVAVTLTLSAALVAPLVAIPVLQKLLAWLPLLFGVALLAFPALLPRVTHGRHQVTPGYYFQAVAVSFAYWFVVGAAFACYIAAFQRLELTTGIAETAAIYLFSWCLGYLALFAPQGIGVSEFISGTLLADGRTVELLAFLVGFRVLVLAGDLLSWGIALMVRQTK